MSLLIDTNIVLNIIRSRDYSGIIEFINPENRSIEAVVAVGRTDVRDGIQLSA